MKYKIILMHYLSICCTFLKKLKCIIKSCRQIIYGTHACRHFCRELENRAKVAKGAPHFHIYMREIFGAVSQCVCRQQQQSPCRRLPHTAGVRGGGGCCLFEKATARDVLHFHCLCTSLRSWLTLHYSLFV